MNQAKDGYVYTRGWGAPFLGIVMGVALMLGAGWVVLSSLFASVGTSASAAIVMIAGSCGVGGVVLALVVAWLLQLIRAERVQVQAPIPAQYEILPAPRRVPLLPATGPAQRFNQSTVVVEDVVLRFNDGRSETVRRAAVDMILRMPVVRRPKEWPFSNESYGLIKDYFCERGFLQADKGRVGTWANQAGAAEFARVWIDA